MCKCCFFGHSQINISLEEELKKTITELITVKGIKEFYVGNNGAFDHYVIDILNELSKEFPDIMFSVILAYLNKDNDICCPNTIYPEGLEFVPPKFAISKRNLWMLDRCEYIVCYIERPFGNAEKFVNTALNKGKEVINLSDMMRSRNKN